MDKVETNEWIIANLKHAGFYRVNYDKNNWELLIQQLNKGHSVIDATSRAQLIDDSFNLGRGEIIDQTVFFRIVSYLVNEEDPLPFQAASTGFDYIDDMFSSDSEAYQLFQVTF